MKNKILSLLLLLGLLAKSTVLAQDTAYISNQGVKLNGQNVELAAYNIKDENYFKLRNLAAALKGSSKEFNVSYDANRQSVIVESNSPYEKLPTDLLGLTLNNQVAMPNIHSFYIDGSMENIKSYNIVDNNYYRLRDLGEYLDFGVAYDYNTNNVIIDTNNPNIQDVPLRQKPQGTARGYVPVDIPNITASSFDQLLDIAELNIMNMEDKFTVMVNIPGFNSYTAEQGIEYILKQIFINVEDNIHIVGNLNHVYIHVYWYGEGNVYQVDFNITYNVNKDERHTLYMQVQNWVRDNIDPSMSDQGKVRKIHDYIVTNNEYDMVNRNGSGVSQQSPYSMLHGGGICEAYASYFALLATEAGLENRFVLGLTFGDLSTSGMSYDQAVESLYARDFEHIWNQVKVDGIWYNIDLTWDDPQNVPFHHYNYYLVSDDIMSKNHVWFVESSIAVPHSYTPSPR